MRHNLTKEERANYQARVKRCLEQAKDTTKNETYRAAAASEAARIKRAYL